MTEAKRDNNQVPTMTGVLNTDGVTPTLVKATLSTHVLDVNDAATGAPPARASAERDGNFVTTLMVQASDGSGLIDLPVNSSGQLLIQST